MRARRSCQPTTRVQSNRRTILLGITLAAMLSATGGCHLNGPLPGRLSAHVRRPQSGVVLFICDGLGWDEPHRRGWLPNIDRRLVAGGTHVDFAAAACPPITYAAIGTILTGYPPAKHGVLGNRWFDPQTALFRDYATIRTYQSINGELNAPTVYERIKPLVSANIQTAVRRGVTRNFANFEPSGVMWFFEAYSGVDRLTGNTIPEVADWANRAGVWQALLTCYFPGADSVGHKFGPQSPEYEAAVRRVDEQVGRICDWLERQRLLETTYLVLVSDHGMVACDPANRIDLMRVISTWGRKPTDYMLQVGDEDDRREYYDKYDTVVAHQNGRGAFLYFRSGNRWGPRLAPAEVERILTAAPESQRLWDLPGIEFAAWLAADNEALLRGPAGSARVQRRVSSDAKAAGESKAPLCRARPPEYAYVPAPDDVLGYLSDPATAAFVKAGFHASRDWLRATAGQPIPDIVPHLVDLLEQPRAGQVVVFTRPGYSFAPERGGHGGVTREEVRATFLVAGPHIPRGKRLDVARATDVTPTLLDLLRVPYSEEQWPDAISLLNVGLLRPLGGAVE